MFDKILDFLKRQRVAFYLSVAAIVLTLIGVITLGISNGVQGYSLNNGALLIVAEIIVMLLIVGGIYLADRFGSYHWIPTIVYLIATVLLCVAFGGILAERVSLAASLFSYDSGNNVGWSAFYPSVVSMVTFILSAIMIAVAAFFKNKART